MRADRPGRVVWLRRAVARGRRARACSPFRGASGRRCSGAARRMPRAQVVAACDVAGGLPGHDRLQRSDVPDCGSVRLGWTRVRRREERDAEGVRQPERLDSDADRRLPHRDRRLLGPRLPRSRTRPRLPGQPLRVRVVRLRRAARADGTRLERRLPDAARADDRRLPGSGQAGAPHALRKLGRELDDADLDGLVRAVPEPFGRRPELRP